MLHIVNKSPYMKGSLESCIRVAQKDDPILLIEDAVLGAAAGGGIVNLVQGAMKDHQIYALGADLMARGIDGLIPGVKVVDYGGFVELVEQHRTMTWL
ncbi:MAG: sulfurtransferase complex subunit TusB [Nitrospirota bacterium]